MPKPLVLIDGHALIYRAYHAFPDLTTSKGVLVNAVYGFTRILLTVLKELSPEYCAVAFDHPQPTFRHVDYVEYKANRPPMPEDLRPQVDLIKRVITAFCIPQFELAGFEADDLIGTLSRLAAEDHHLPVLIVTGDRDAFQLVDKNVHVWMPSRTKQGEDIEYDEACVEQKMGVKPSQIIDLKALMGDASDNIPGVAGIGEKTAVKLLQEFGSVSALYEQLETGHTDALKPAVIKKLHEGKDSALLSQKLATINRAVPITFDLEACRVSSYRKEGIVALFKEFEFESLVPALPSDAFELGVQNALF